jgi:hypothetical protein
MKARTVSNWEKLRAIIEAEPVVDEFRPMCGLLSALGIEKDKPFAQDARMKGILVQPVPEAYRAGQQMNENQR